MRAAGVDFANEKVDVAHRPEPWILVHQMRERRAFQDEKWHLGLRHRVGDVRDYPRPDCRRVRVLRPPCPEATPKVVWKTKPVRSTCASTSASMPCCSAAVARSSND